MNPYSAHVNFADPRMKSSTIRVKNDAVLMNLDSARMKLAGLRMKNSTVRMKDAPVRMKQVIKFMIYYQTSPEYDHSSHPYMNTVPDWYQFPA